MSKSEVTSDEIIHRICNNTPSFAQPLSENDIKLVNRMKAWLEKDLLLRRHQLIDGNFDKIFQEATQECSQKDFLRACIISEHPHCIVKFTPLFKFCKEGKKKLVSLFQWLHADQSSECKEFLKKAMLTRHPRTQQSLLEFAYVRCNGFLKQEMAQIFNISVVEINTYFQKKGIYTKHLEKERRRKKPENLVQKNPTLSVSKRKRKKLDDKTSQPIKSKKNKLQKVNSEVKDDLVIFKKVKDTYKICTLNSGKLTQFKNFFKNASSFFDQKEFLIACKIGLLSPTREFIPLLSLSESKLKILFKWLLADKSCQPLLNEIIYLRDPATQKPFIEAAESGDFFKNFLGHSAEELISSPSELSYVSEPHSPLSPMSPLPPIFETLEDKPIPSLIQTEEKPATTPVIPPASEPEPLQAAFNPVVQSDIELNRLLTANALMRNYLLHTSLSLHPGLWDNALWPITFNPNWFNPNWVCNPYPNFTPYVLSTSRFGLLAASPVRNNYIDQAGLQFLR